MPVETFRREGWARLGVVLAGAPLDELRERVDQLMLVRHDGLFYQHDSASGAYEDLAYGKGWVGPSLAYRKLEKLEHDPVVRAWIENPVFAAMVKAIVGAEVAIYRAMLMNKAARGGTLLPWHQDGGLFWGVDRAPILQIWTALDDAGEDSGCLEIVPGTHLARARARRRWDHRARAPGPRARRRASRARAGRGRRGAALAQPCLASLGREPERAAAPSAVVLLHGRGHALPAHEARAAPLRTGILTRRLSATLGAP
jgi:phytanoyl-CoA hydroxylase